MLESMYHDPKAKAGYSREDGSFGRPNIRSPGGLSHPNCGIDFNDITTMFARALVEGLFGWRPDYPKGLVTLAPFFPWAWDRASIATPDFSLSYSREGQLDIYRSKLARPARRRFMLPVRAERVLSVLVDGEAASFGSSAEEIWLLVCGSTNPMQLGFPNAAFRFRYEDGVEELLELVPPRNFWSLCGFGRTDYDYRRDGWVLPPSAPPHVSLGENCRAMVYGWRLRAGVGLESLWLEALAHEVVIGLMAASLANPG